ncbi:KdsC family phosphatase [Novosphingobium aquimarinum]|uniref:KdsC family phosphatase n=1 Tax=Novosphingobium aquimarinum TaxID=2682494 RepID=UPI0018DEC49C|nr:HAD-IIIA family hydrolase [Novosphingobium aquimarinum]
MVTTIRLVLFDIDGVFTDNRLYVGSEGEVFKAFNARDGVGIALLQSHGIECGTISGKRSAALEYRMRELKMDIISLGVHDKLGALEEIRRDNGYTDDEIAFVGDDVIDLSVMNAVALSYAPADAHPLVIDAADHVMHSNGGGGVVREVAEHLLEIGGIARAEQYNRLMDQWGRQQYAQ